MTFSPPLTRIDRERGRGRRTTIVLAVVALVVWFDQVSKAWAWRTRDDVRIDSGGGFFVSEPWGSLWSDPTTGPMIDVLGLGVLILATVLVARRRRSVPLLTGAALAIAGWSSNLADRLGLHSVTAPGSERGVVDFLVWHGRIWNLADAAIGLGLALVAVGVLLSVLRTLGGPNRRTPYPSAPPAWHPDAGRLPALAAPQHPLVGTSSGAAVTRAR